MNRPAWLILLAIIALPARLAWAEPPPANDPLFIRLGAHPSPAQAVILDGGGRQHSSFEVYVTNAGATPMKIVGVDVTGVANGKLLWSQKKDGKRVSTLFQPVGSKGAPTSEVLLKPSASGVLFLFPDFIADQPGKPAQFETSITVAGQGERGGSGTVHIAPLPVSPDAPIVIQSPLRGANWIAVNGPSNTSDHRRAILYYDGQPYIGQRYAIDWVILGADGATYTGAQHDNASYHAWNQAIHAVTDGKIVALKDRIPENVPNSGKLAVSITDETIAGNHIIEDLGGGHFAAYAHLRPGTLKVKVGDPVHAGDVIAHLGNTGNSSEPHLHFQVCDAPAFLKSEGLPFAIDQFVHQEYKGTAGQGRLVRGATHQISREEPLEDELDTFAGK